MEAVFSPETFMDFYLTTRHYIPHDSTITIDARWIIFENA
jgi:hypothetical protein